ncbi:hypothetical protein [Nitrosopumilus adriaticus]|uniref:CopG family transcriptional regulator n=1 Tax=Nitrosopumilus adriaticus TaxID=1580092 RepID=A0A0D5C3S5_9ARCH|nr:hypothetical protein [Nitrosopumilus adriaticus]AJW70995.1 hypothetical protein NADRNF5_1309 [Nitrosopumilus adriaticus]
MSKRVTIMLSDSLDKKIRLIQAKKIKEHAISYSYSKTINDILEKSL